MKKLFAVALIGLASTTSAHAAPIIDLHNTGVTNSGTPLANGAVDPHWDIVGAQIAYAGNPIHPTWLTNASSLASRWITPQTNGNQSLDPSVDGLYRYFTTFDLTGFNPATASFSGRFAADNLVDSITLNGNTITGAGGGFTSWTPFSASSSAFVSGANTLVFNVRNLAQRSGNPSGLRVEFLQSDVAAAVPEPATWAMMLLGFGAIGVGMRRRSPVVARVRFA